MSLVVLAIFCEFKRISYGHQYVKIATPKYQIRSELRKTHGIRTLSVWPSWFDNVNLTIDSATSMYCNTLSNQLSHTKRVRVPCVLCNQSGGAFLVRHWSCAYSIRNFVRISYAHLLFWDTTLPYYNRMILSKNAKSFIPISHKKLFTKIVTAPHTKFVRDFFRCGHTWYTCYYFFLGKNKHFLKSVSDCIYYVSS